MNTEILIDVFFVISILAFLIAFFIIVPPWIKKKWREVLGEKGVKKDNIINA